MTLGFVVLEIELPSFEIELFTLVVVSIYGGEMGTLVDDKSAVI